MSNPGGYECHTATGVACPIGLDSTSYKADRVEVWSIVGKSAELPEQGWFRIPTEYSDEIGYLLVGIDPAFEYAWREVGLDRSGNVVHRCPDQRFPMGGYGWFDPHTPPVSEGVAISKDEFEHAWSLEPILPR
jgi:hypothetical protein